MKCRSGKVVGWAPISRAGSTTGPRQAVRAWAWWRAVAAQAADSGLPCLNEADVVVVGGGVGAVAAAAGARAVRFTSLNYLGKNIAERLLLWPRPPVPSDLPLVARRSHDPAAPASGFLPFRYSADRPANSRHPGTSPPSRLADRLPAGDPLRKSVQYDDDVILALDLGAVHRVREVIVTVFCRPGDFELGAAELSVSDDRRRWRDIPADGPSDGRTLVAFVPDGPFRHALLTLRQASGARRLLAGRVMVLAGPPLIAEAARRVQERDVPTADGSEVRNPVERLARVLGRRGDPPAGRPTLTPDGGEEVAR